LFVCPMMLMTDLDKNLTSQHLHFENFPNSDLLLQFNFTVKISRAGDSKHFKVLSKLKNC
jgi:hypothetical protein